MLPGMRRRCRQWKRKESASFEGPRIIQHNDENQTLAFLRPAGRRHFLHEETGGIPDVLDLAGRPAGNRHGNRLHPHGGGRPGCRDAARRLPGGLPERRGNRPPARHHRLCLGMDPESPAPGKGAADGGASGLVQREPERGKHPYLQGLCELLQVPLSHPSRSPVLSRPESEGHLRRRRH